MKTQLWFSELNVISFVKLMMICEYSLLFKIHTNPVCP